MNKMNNKGFMIVEILVVTTIVMLIFLTIYVNYFPLVGEYEKRIEYNDITTEYSLFHIKKIYAYSENNSLIRTELANSGVKYINLLEENEGNLVCKSAYINSSDLEYCNQLIANYEVKSLIVSQFNIVDLKAVSIEEELDRYIDYLPGYTSYTNDNGIYRLIIKTESGFSTTKLDIDLLGLSIEYINDYQQSSSFLPGETKLVSINVCSKVSNIYYQLNDLTSDNFTINTYYPNTRFLVSKECKVESLIVKYNGSTTADGVNTSSLYSITPSKTAGNFAVDSGYEAMTENTNLTYNYISNYQEFIIPKTGYYKVELWGAQGGDATYTTPYIGGKGGYTYGEIYLNQNEKIYIYVGGQGQKVTGTSTGTLIANGNGYNGGAVGTFAANNSTHGGGGGATDIKYFGGTTPTTSDLLWNSTIGLNSRIMVAGGGGGAASHSSTPSYSGTGGTGGNLIGGTAVNGSATCYAYGIGGAQIAGGSSTNCPTDGHAYAGIATFGIGKSPYTEYTTGFGYAGGGGGYYGGGSGYHAAGGGGASFISGYAGVNAITSSSSTTPTNNTKHYSNKYFINSKMEAGVNNGNGKAQITFVGATDPIRMNSNLNNVRYIKDCINGSTANTGNHWVELQAIYQAVNVAYGKTVTGTAAQDSSYPYSRITDGNITSSSHSYTSSTGLQCITVDLTQSYNLDEIAVWHYYTDNRTYTDNITYVSSDNSTWVEVINKKEAESNIGKRASVYDNTTLFPYKGAVLTYTVPKTGTYKLEVWGAQGGSYNTTYYGGYGGYSIGNINLTKDTALYIYVGQQGVNSNTINPSSYNGGGAGSKFSTTGSSWYWSSGGGATHIAITSGLLSTLSSSTSSILIVAGGGGGTGYDGSSALGGSGGGYLGKDGAQAGSWGVGTGGSQSAAGAGGGGAGAFGQGGIGYSSDWGSGGGGGFYGGGGSRSCSGAGGGSGYIGNPALTNKYMYCYNCTTSGVAATLTYTTTTVEASPTSNSAKAGNGYAKITFIE